MFFYINQLIKSLIINKSILKIELFIYKYQYVKLYNIKKTDTSKKYQILYRSKYKYHQYVQYNKLINFTL